MRKSTARYKSVGLVVLNCRINLISVLNFFKYAAKSVKQYVTVSEYKFSIRPGWRGERAEDDQDRGVGAEAASVNSPGNWAL
ncbi:MAG: hypothetical protein BGO21_01950 [Dyadobacter sp. 50-39]|nr:MAG: hypothetical protein BGO21_01950 [Dyadobacter sp. 50-39]